MNQNILGAIKYTKTNNMEEFDVIDKEKVTKINWLPFLFFEIKIV